MEEYSLSNSSNYPSPPLYTPQGFYYLNLHPSTTQYHETTITPQIFGSSGITTDFNNYPNTTRYFSEYCPTESLCHSSNNTHLTNNENCNNNYYTNDSNYEIHEENFNKKLLEKVHEKSNSDCDCSYSYTGSDDFEIAPYEGKGLQIQEQSASEKHDLAFYADVNKKNYLVLNSGSKTKESGKVDASESRSKVLHTSDQGVNGN